MNRRGALLSIGSGIAVSMLKIPAWATESAIRGKTKLGIDDFSYNIRSRAEQAGYTPKVTHDPLTFLKYCHSIGAGGLQCVIGKRDEAYVKELRAYVEDNNLFIEDSAWLGGKVDLERFEAGVASVKAAGARAIRGFCGGRRYEQFDKREQFDEFANRAWKTIESVAPIVEKHRIPLAIDRINTLTSQVTGIG